MDDDFYTFEELAALASAQVPDLEAEARAEYNRMYNVAPETIHENHDRIKGEGRFHGGSLVWDAVDWSM
jgi:hypothetical protein